MTVKEGNIDGEGLRIVRVGDLGGDDGANISVDVLCVEERVNE